MTVGEVRVLVYYATEDLDGAKQAYAEISAELDLVPGMVGHELLRSVHDRLGIVVLSRWASLAAFQTWETGVAHKDSTAPLRKYRDSRMPTPFGIYQVEAA
ncbi:MAG TPA: antibiotic biosynthesis monooxygenase [Pseudonocardiaceae bacterium]|jgi:heme-degrading monooxygenase HmoA|nr:antibiotic biosynthesis monooxygenase [Pseudonocardiaceae bacterium]